MAKSKPIEPKFQPIQKHYETNNPSNNSLATNPNPFNQIPTYEKHYENNPSKFSHKWNSIWELQITNWWCMHGGGRGGGRGRGSSKYGLTQISDVANNNRTVASNPASGC
jgi:hypothetical protein